MDNLTAYLAYNFVMNDQIDVTEEAIVEDAILLNVEDFEISKEEDDEYWDNDKSEEDSD
ncbi:MAG: hypothetical protein PHF25_03310 [Candidatus Margulisbacteria bacterium]|nr:hypothetical protein [Candidatus Margulisiibacteriota bacterium]